MKGYVFRMERQGRLSGKIGPMKTPTLFEKKNIRTSGILMHISSLPSPWGTGDLGPGADSFVDFLVNAGQGLWQMLPLSPTDPGQANSPYSGLSAFAGNPLFISPEILADDGLLDPSDIKAPGGFPAASADYVCSARAREPLFRKAFAAMRSMPDPGFSSFCEENFFWLDDFALFSALKTTRNGSPWYEWPVPLRDREGLALEEARRELAGEMSYQKFLQYVFFRQWNRLRNICARRGIALVGDIPVYVSHDSADVWSNRRLFDLDGEGRPRNVAGVPPDYFSPLGQRWGNPVYRWDILEADGFGWWLGRLEHALSLFDLVRVDHFRGLIKYWSIPAKEKTAVKGRWVDASPDAFFAKVRETFPEMPFIAENLGVITPDVTAWVERLGVPGMLVLQFAFGDDFEKNPYAPANHIENACVYTGTHDNDTSRGWFETVATTGVKRQIESLAGHEVTPESVSMDMISIAMRSKARMAIIPMQDILGLGTEGRLNTPGTASGNWVWRVDERGLENVPVSFLADLALQNGRLAPSPPGVR